MTRAVLVLRNQADRDKAAAWCRNAPPGTRLEFKQIKRSLPQNDRMWAMLTDISRQAKLHGLVLTPDDWKLVFLDGLKRELRLVPNLDGNGVVSLGRSSSDLGKAEMTDLIELMFAWGAQNGVIFQDDMEAV